MRFLKYYVICVLIISLMFTGCLGVAGESFQDIVEEAKFEIMAEDLLSGYGDLETCMFTMWYFTKPDAPPIEQAKNVCKNIIISMDEYEFKSVIEDIERELERIEVEPVICTGNCI